MFVRDVSCLGRIVGQINQLDPVFYSMQLPITSPHSPLAVAALAPEKRVVVQGRLTREERKQTLAIEVVVGRQSADRVQRRRQNVKGDDWRFDRSPAFEPFWPADYERRTNAAFIKTAFETAQRAIVRAHCFRAAVIGQKEQNCICKQSFLFQLANDVADTVVQMLQHRHQDARVPC